MYITRLYILTVTQKIDIIIVGEYKMDEKQPQKKINKKAVMLFLKQYGIITLGCIIYSLGIALFLDPYDLASGGVYGISVIIRYLCETYLGWVWLTTPILIIALNIPLFILGAVFFGKKFVLSTIYSTVVSSLLISLWKIFTHNDTIIENELISALIGGALFGLGLGLIFKMGSTTGGTDIIVRILRKKFRYIRTGLISMCIDFTIVLISTLVMQDIEHGCYTVISIVIFTTLFDWVLSGGNSAKLIYIISTQEKSKIICDRLLKELDVGATYIDGEGAYTGESKRIIMCAAKNFLYPKLRDIVHEVDPHAFTIVSSANEVYGEGYKEPTDGDI